MTITLDDLRDTADGPPPEWYAKQIHPLPEATVVSREAFLLDFARGRVVLDVGASGPMSAAIEQVAVKYYGIDKEYRYGDDGNVVVAGFDLDNVSRLIGDGLPMLPICEGQLVVICGEVLEHLSNPGVFLQQLNRAYPRPTVFTVPNAYAAGSRKWLDQGEENVNADHVAWHSPWTLKTLLGRAGYKVEQWHWYNGTPPYSEGIIAVAR